MIDLRKTIMAGIGASLVTKDKIEAALQDLVKQRKVSTEEARTLAMKLAEEGRREWESAGKDLAEKLEVLLAKADYARKADLQALERRISELEKRLQG